MNSDLLVALNGFLGRASKATYAGDGNEVETQRKGFKELEYSEADWYYRDSYTGYLRSWGQEVVYHENKPYWTCLYGGGMNEDNMNSGFADKTFNFLKKALSEGEKESSFQPRGPKEFTDDSWSYECNVDGSIDKFSGHEVIKYNNKIVFTHDFFGGLVVSN